MNYLLIRGLARHQGHWHQFPELLKTKTNQVICLDSIGNGEFAHLNSPINLVSNTEFLREKWQTKIINNEPWTLISISMGGMIALDWCAKYPEDFKKFYIMNTSAANIVPPWKRFSFSTFIKLPKLIFNSPFNQEKEILSITLAKQLVNAELIESNLNFNLPRTTIANFWKQLLSASLFKTPKIKNTDRLVFIVGLRDKLVSPINTIKIASYYKAKLIIAKELGHDIPLDDANWLRNIISDQTFDG